MMCLESIIPYQLFMFTQLNPYVGLAHLEWFLFGASVIQYSCASILLGSWMVFLVAILVDPIFGSRSYSPYPRVKGLLIFVVNCDLLANPIISLSLRASCIPFFGLHLFLTPLSIWQKEFYLFSPVVPGVIRLPQSNSIYFMDSLLPLGWLQRLVTPEFHISYWSHSGDSSISLIP